MDPKGKAYGINKSTISGLIFEVEKHRQRKREKKKEKNKAYTQAFLEKSVWYLLQKDLNICF